MTGGDEARDKGGAKDAHMIPGVDGKLQFGFPQRLITTLRYADTGTIVAAAGVAGDRQYRMNSIFDPGLTAGTRQPMWRDTFNGIYSKYRVLGSRLTVTFANPPSVVDNIIVGIVGRPSVTIPSTALLDRIEFSDSISRMVAAQDGRITLSWVYEPNTKLGFNSQEDNVGALMTTNPAEQYIATVWASGITDANTDYMVTIEYTVEFFSITEEAASLGA